MGYKFFFDHVHTYLKSHYLTLPQLARAAETSEAEIEEYIHAGCIPAACYVLQASNTVTSPLSGEVRIDGDKAVEYHSPSTIEWLARAKHLARESSVIDLPTVAKLMHFQFETEFALALTEMEAQRYGFADCFMAENAISREKLHLKVDSEWKNALQGLYGIVLRGPVCARSIVKNGVLTARLMSITDNGEKEVLTSAEKDELLRTMREFNELVSEFPPHEHAVSVRKRLFDDLIPRYGLQNHFHRNAYPSTV